jgi:hypothetical protein
MAWFRGEEPGDPRPEIICLTIVAALIAFVATTELVSLMLGLRAVPVDDVVDAWEPSVWATVVFVPVESVLLGLILMFRGAASTSTRRLASWSVAIASLGVVALLADHLVISKGVWGHFKVF